MEVDPYFHYYLEQLALGDQKRTTPKVLNYLKHEVEKQAPEDQADLIAMIQKYQELLEKQNVEENQLLSLVILHYLKNNVQQIDPSDYDYLKKIREKCDGKLTGKQIEEFDYYLETAKVKKFTERSDPFPEI